MEIFLVIFFIPISFVAIAPFNYRKGSPYPLFTLLKSKEKSYPEMSPGICGRRIFDFNR
jgi:hypothetical protein